MTTLNTIDKLARINQVAVVDRLTRKEFYENFVDRERPVVIKNMTEGWNALNWNAQYFKENENGVKLAIKVGDVSKGERVNVLLSEYVERLQEYEQQRKRGEQPESVGYLHDVPFFYLFPHMVPDIEPFPIDLFPKWYWPKWHNYIQFFMGATGSLTPLHFDTLLTNNLFFQVHGKKRFILIAKTHKDQCYMEGWRWAKFDPNQPDYEKFPEAKGVKIMEAIIGPGDILFIPSGMLHQVHGLSYSISFNIDWHTPKTARAGVKSWLDGAPRQNLYYNFLSFLGLSLKVPSKYIFPYYKSYLNYVS